MNGLKYVREKFKMTLNDLSDRLKISRQAVSMWEQGKKPIPKKRQAELSTIFDMPEEYFSEIDDIQVLEIDNYILDDAISNSEFEYEDCFQDSDGNIHTVMRKDIDRELVAYSDYNDAQIEKKKLLQKIDRVISDTHSDDIMSIYSEIEHMALYTRLYDRYTDLVQKYSIRGIMFQVLRALEISLDVNKKSNSIWGNSRIMDGLISDQEPFVQKLVKLVVEEKNKREKERLEQIELIKTISENKSDDDLDLY